MKIRNFELCMRLRQVPEALFDYAGTINAEPFVYKGKTYPPETLLCSGPTISKEDDSELHDVTIVMTYKENGWNRFPLPGNRWEYKSVYLVVVWSELKVESREIR